jgi:hypothetical protein
MTDNTIWQNGKEGEKTNTDLQVTTQKMFISFTYEIELEKHCANVTDESIEVGFGYWWKYPMIRPIERTSGCR